MEQEKNRNPHIGSHFDDFLEEEGIAPRVTAEATRQVIAALVKDHMQRAKLTKTAMAARMNTSRQALDRLLDPEGGGLTLDTLERAAIAVGKRVRIVFDDAA
jgi:hypothetical protein